ncbi:winged helix-turn-helix domain-containing protein [Cyanobacterium aponinum FACHB-4101]|uniref:winged helix-turn-helix domain-containing protein n=1 Tax=Cyanobacterium aponinum TaxID=379064 RepID=UPI001680638F|nr:winged helix-turn-helix domain-containing protein [Cyanobacterium aponinum]MBD2395807.1 winged helix-turn-helix domain-containing protein [Cyanobacterium aponinum FACHB-4101]
MARIKFIKSRGGLTTTERILQIIQENPKGLTLKSLKQEINRPVSMLNICLKTLIQTKQIRVIVELSEDQVQKIYSCHQPLNPK